MTCYFDRDDQEYLLSDGRASRYKAGLAFRSSWWALCFVRRLCVLPSQERIARDMDDFDDDDLSQDDDQLTEVLEKMAQPATTAEERRIQLLQVRRSIEDWREARAIRDDIDYLDEISD